MRNWLAGLKDFAGLQMIKSLFTIAMVWGLVGCSGGIAAPPSTAAGSRLLSTYELDGRNIVGETISADVEAMGVHLGAFEMHIQTPCSDSPSETLIVKSEMRTEGLARLAKNAGGAAETRLNRHNGAPTESYLRLQNSDEVKEFAIEFAPGAFRYRYEKTDAPTREGEEPLAGEAYAHDMQSAFLLLRHWRPRIGTLGYFYVVLGRRLWRADVEYKGREVVVVDGVPKVAVGIEGTAYRLRGTPGKKYEPREFALWFSDDARRIPVRAIGKSSLGPVIIDLTSRTLDRTACEEVPASKPAKTAEAK